MIGTTGKAAGHLVGLAGEVVAEIVANIAAGAAADPTAPAIVEEIQPCAVHF